jgi:hypothetical protein
MILICGVPTEAPAALAIAAAEELGVAHAVFDQRQHAEAELALRAEPQTGVGGRLAWPSGSVDLAEVSGVYVRLADDRFLPDLTALPEDAPERLRAGIFHERLYSWLNIAPGRVASRPRAMLSNMSKTYQADVIRRFGFEIPETVVTNDPAEALAFVAHCGEVGDEVIYKSVSGARSIVQTFRPEDAARLSHIRWCPTQFQRRIAGVDIRVHVVGLQTFATEIASAAVDYRYAERQTGEDAELSATELPPALRQACVRLAHAMDLPFAGIDLRRMPSGAYACFEVNPCPAFSYYESRTGAPIARALVSWLAGYDARRPADE